MSIGVSFRACRSRRTLTNAAHPPHPPPPPTFPIIQLSPSYIQIAIQSFKLASIFSVQLMQIYFLTFAGSASFIDYKYQAIWRLCAFIWCASHQLSATISLARIKDSRGGRGKEEEEFSFRHFSNKVSGYYCYYLATRPRHSGQQDVN